MKELKDHSIEDMKAEIARRTRPTVLHGVDQWTIRQRLNLMVDDRERGDFEESQIHYFWELTMKDVYGPDVFDWWNAQEGS